MSTPVSGRRVARRERRGVDVLTVLGAVLVVLAAALFLAAGAVESEPEPAARAGTVPVDEVVTACAAFPAAGAGEALTLAAPLPGTESGGSVTAGPVGGRTEPVDAPRGVLETLDLASGEEGGAGWALGVTAEGAAAVGRSTSVVDRARGVAAVGVQECLAPRARWWFTGAGAGLDHTSTLVVANLDPGRAVIDVEVHGPGGLVDSVGTRGITVQPGEVQAIDLVDVAPQTEELAVHVEASRGRVVAALADGFATRPAAAAGRDWIPVQADASKVLRLSPLPARADRRTLVVANPTAREALADVEISTPSGSFVPTDLPQLRVAPGSVVTADLGPAVGKEAAAVLLDSPVPLTATVRSARAADVTYAAAAPLLDGPSSAVLAEDTTATLQLTAGDAGGTADVTAFSADGDEVETAALEVEPGTTLTWTPEGRAAYLVVSPGRGRLFGGVSLAGAAGLSQVPLRPLPVELRRPVVTPVVR
ncbi:MAG TPA: DUF5719 family protein [Nocardioidaceae bacterium]|nr:DUF5719 family protein [Nocardioidaceae bacterium]